MFVLCVLYTKNKGTGQDNQEKETSRGKVQRTREGFKE
jgi:hypothetical protein